MSEHQWRVEEESTDGDSWYNHGYSGDNEDDARRRLRELRDTYGKYGRRFRLVVRQIGPWEVAE